MTRTGVTRTADRGAWGGALLVELALTVLVGASQAGASGPEAVQSADDAIARVRQHLVGASSPISPGPMVALPLGAGAGGAGTITAWLVVTDAGVFWVTADDVAGPLRPRDAEALLAECSCDP